MHRQPFSCLALRLLAAVFLLIPALPATADDLSTALDEIRALRQQLQQLQDKVNRLEQQQQTPPAASSTLATNSTQRLNDLDQKLRSLEQAQEQARIENARRSNNAPRLVVGSEGFALENANRDFVLQLRGLLQVDSRTFFADADIPGNDTLLMRRVRPIIQGTVYRDIDFFFDPDFAPNIGPQLFDAYLNYKLMPEVQLLAGKFKEPVGLEYLQLDQFTMFNERGLTTYLVPGRDVGFELHGELFSGTLTYAAGIFNGLGDGRNSSNVAFEDDKAFAGRISFQPFKNRTTWYGGIGVGLAGSYEDMQKTNTAGLPQTTGGTLAGYNTEGQQQFFAYNPASGGPVVAHGDHWRISPQAWYFHGPLNFMGEYVVSNQRVSTTGTNAMRGRMNNTGWQIEAGWVLTGEEYGYATGVRPARPLRPLQGDWGAWQLVARYSQLRIDNDAFPTFADPLTSAHEADAWSLGFNWYWNRNVTMRTSFTHTTFNGGGGSRTVPGIVTQKDENVLFTRLQLWF